MANEINSWSSPNAAGAFASPLKLLLAGQRFYNGQVTAEGLNGFYWSSTVDGAGAMHLYLAEGTADMSDDSRASGFSVRCIKD